MEHLETEQTGSIADRIAAEQTCAEPPPPELVGISRLSVTVGGIRHIWTRGTGEAPSDFLQMALEAAGRLGARAARFEGLVAVPPTFQPINKEITE